MPHERAARRIRCTGPLCREKKDEKQLHHASEMVFIPGGGRFCVDCVKEAARLVKVAEDDRHPQAEFELVQEASVQYVEEIVAVGPVYGTVDQVVVRVDVPETTPETTPETMPESVAHAADPAHLPAPTTQVDLGDPLIYTRFPDERVEGWPLRKGRLSASSIGTFVMCPEKFRQKEIVGQREPSGGAGIAGGAAHKGVEAYLRYVMMQGEPPPPTVWHEWLHAKFDKEVEREGGVIEWGKSATGEKLPFTADDVRGRAVQAAGTYIDKIAPHLNPIAVEDPFVVYVEGCPVPVVGSKDIVEVENVIDMKFGKAQSNLDPGWRIQGLIYLLSDEKDMVWHSVGWPKVDGTCTFHTPLDAPGLRLPRSYENYSIATDLIRSSVQSIMAYTEMFGLDNPWPGNLSHQYACDTCAFRKDGSCAWWHRHINAEDLL